jgi:ring-1,2-phenylacetyl-CoA epoxidase subunit PaaE
MPKFHSLKIKEVRRETDECVSLSFEVPEALEEEYGFTQGQHLTLRTEIDGEELRRSYSICASPEEGELRVAVKRVEGGRFSTFVNDQLEEGAVLDVMTPMGRFFTPLDPQEEKHYVAFAAGSGITPVISILKTVLLKEPKSRFTLFYGNRRVDSIIFREELEGLKNRFMGRLALHHILSRERLDSELFSGRITGEKAMQFFEKLIDPADVDEFFLCGPYPMIESIRETLWQLSVDKEKIHFELFTPAGGWNGEKKKKAEKKPRPEGIATVTVTLDGKSFSFPMSSAEDSILEAAQRTGADLPFACKGGVCSSCRAKLEQGEVDMAVNYALEEDEVEAGYILTCQSFPKTKEVKVNFDA